MRCLLTFFMAKRFLVSLCLTRYTALEGTRGGEREREAERERGERERRERERRERGERESNERKWSNSHLYTQAYP